MLHLQIEIITMIVKGLSNILPSLFYRCITFINCYLFNNRKNKREERRKRKKENEKDLKEN